MSNPSANGADLVSNLDEGLDRAIPRLADELEVIDEHLQLDDRDLLELGCGRAEKTRAIATAGRGRRVLALEVDTVQHAINAAVTDLPNVLFAAGGAEAIPVADMSCDVTFLFKSLHHVPVPAMDRALAELARVLRPGGHAWISEPLFRGEFNEVLRLFHDESKVRRAAFAAIGRAVRAGVLEHAGQVFFGSPLHFADFAAFERQVIGVTHTRHVLDEATLQRVRQRFADFANADGSVDFVQPIRVDLLRRRES